MTEAERKRREEIIKKTKGQKSSTGYQTSSLSNDEIKRREEKIKSHKKSIINDNSKTTPTTSRAGVKTESNTAVTPSVNASVAERNAARRSAQKENTEKKFTQPGNSGQLPGDARSQKINETIKSDTTKKQTSSSVSSSAPKVGMPEFNRASDMKTDAELRGIAEKTKGMSDEERKRFLTEEAQKRSRTTSNADIVLLQNQRREQRDWEQEKADYLYQKENGWLKENDATTQKYIDKFYSMGEDERQLVASLTNKPTTATYDKLMNEYGYSFDDIDAMRYFYGRYINKRNAKTDDINARLAMEKHPFLESIASVPMGLAGGVMAAGGILDSYVDNKMVKKIGIQDQGIDYNHQFSKLQRQAQSGRDEFTKTHDFMIGGYDVGDMLYNTALSGVESMASAVVPGGAALLAVNAGTSKINELSQRGLSSEKAIVGGVVAAAAEFLFEKISIGNFKKMQEIQPDTIMDVVKNLAKSMGVNASEEALTETANILYDTFANGELSDYQMQVENLVNSGEMTRVEAEKKVRNGLIGQVVEAAVSGAIMGSGFSAVTTVPNYMGRSAAITQLGAQARQKGMAQQVIAEAQAAPKGSKANKTFKNSVGIHDDSGKYKLDNNGKYVSDYKLGLMAVQSNDFANSDKGRFSNVETQAELDERYQSAMQMKKDKGSDSAKQIQKEYEQTQARIRMKNAAEGAKPTGYKKTDVLTRVEITNPTVNVDGKEYTAQGKNVDTKTGEISDAQTVFKDADGDNAIRFGDGKTMKVSEAVKHMTDKTAKEVYKATEGMTAEAANLFVSNYDGDDIGDYSRAFKYVSDMGRTGLSATQIREYNPAFGNYFTTQAQEQIAAEGLKNREFRAGVTELTYARNTKQFKQTVQLIDQYAKESGLEVIILNENTRVNGYHLQGTNRIVLYANVGGKENLMTRTFGHETFHFISENSSEEADKLRNYVTEALKKNGVDIEAELSKYGNIKDDNGNLVYATREAQIDELVADSMFDVFTNKAAIDRLAKNDRSLAQKIADKFKEILNVIRTKLKMIGETSENNPEIKALMNDADSLEQIVNKFHEALDVAKNNYNVHDSEKDAGKAYSVNQQLTNINIKGYNIDKKSPLSLENRAKANSNSSIKWVYDAEIFSFEESKLFHHKISEINQGFKSFEKNADDEYMIPIGNKIVFTDGNYDNPYIDRIVEVLTDSATRFEDVREIVYDVEKGRQDLREASQFMRQIQGDELVVQYKNRADKVYGWADRNYKRKNRRAVIADYIRKQNREGNAGEGSTDKALSSAPKNFSISASTEEKGELVAVHNIYVDKMMDAFKLGGFPMPSIAVTKAKQGHDKYGPISVVFNKNTIDPKADDRNKVYAADAYSPTFPNVKLTANKEKARALAEILNTSIAGVENNILDKTENEIIRKAGTHHQLQRKFIEDNGIKIDGMKEPKLTNAYHKRMKAFVVENDITWDKLVNNAELRDEYIQKVAESSPSFRRENTISQIKAIFENEFLINNDDIRDSFDKDFEILKDRVQPSFDESTYLYNIRDYLADYNNPSGYKSDYVEFIKGYTDGLVDKTEIYTGEDRFFENGEENPNAFKDYTAENVVDVMKAQAHQPGGGIGYLRALLGQKFSSIDDIRNNKGKIVSEDLFNEAADRLNDKFTSIASMGASFNNGMGLWNVTHDTFVQAIENGATKKAMIDALNDNGFRYVKPYFVDACMSFIEELKTVPTEYFEAKPERAVGFDEIEFVVVPDNAPAQLIEQLNENGIEIKKYKAGDKTDRIAALNSRPDILFSMNKDSSIDAHYGEVIKELNQWRVIGDLLTEEGIEHTNKDSMLNSRDIHRISKNIITKTKSKYDLATLENQLTAVFEYIKASGKHVDATEVSEVLYKLSHDVLSQSEMSDTELYEQYSDVRKLLHDTQVYIPENVRKEIASQFGDFKSFRNQLMGKMMHITTTDSNARSLDEVWQELSEMAPEYFPKDTNELDMPMQLTRFFEIIAPKTVNPYEHYEMNIADEAAVLANDIFTDYTKIRLEKTDSGKAKDILNAGMHKLSESKKAMIAEFDRKKLQNADEYRARLAEYRQQRQNADRRRVNRNEIERNYNYVNRRYVNGKDTDKILKKFNDVTQAYVKSVPDANSRFSKQNLIEFENEYRKLEGETVFYDSDFATKISTFRNLVTQKEIGMPRLRDLDNVELQMLTDITSHMKYIVQTENRLFNESIKAKADELGMKIDSEFKNKGESKLQGIGDNSTRREVVAHKVDELIKGFVKPAYLFDNLGSETLKMLYDEIQKGENIEAKIIYDSKLAEQDIKKRNNYDARWNSQTVELNLRSGKRAVSVEDAMALYATSKRKQGLEHLINGGAVIYSAKDIRKNEKRWQDIKKTVLKNAKKNRLELSDAEVTKRTNDIYNSEIAESDKITIKERVYFNEQDIAEIEKALTPDQRKYVDEMVEYITSDIGEKRNEVSMKLYGYEKYKESYYFPIKVDRNFIDTSVGRPEVVSTIQNQSSAKKTVDRAKNPIEITGFTNTVNNHIYDSALYCAYVLPISDFRRVYNFKDKVPSGEGAESLVYRDVSVKEDIKKANGVNAINEIEKFMIALDSGSRYENVMPVSAQLASRMKKTAVMANLSVVVQQPTAVFRAMLYVNPKYFTTWANKADIEEMKRWNGCALKKEIGYFDVNMGRSATDYMNEYDTDKSIKKDWSLKDKFKNSNGMQKLDDAAGWAASKADEQTWGAIWNACKKQVKSENSSLSGDSLNSAASELFQKTISKTQVYDSVFTKPEFMRRKEGFAMMTTQFMSEPLTSLNMLAEAVSKQKNAEKGSQQRKDARKFTARAFGCFATSLVVNSALKSLIYTMRDDDEENTFLEKYIANFTEGVATDPIGMIPYVKDVLSIVQGYELERTDVAVFTTFAEAVKNLGNDNKSTFDKIMGVMKAAGQASGIPAYNVVRDAKAIIGIASKIVDGIQNGFPETTGRGILNELKDVFGWVPGIDAQTNYEQLYDSMLKGDKKHYDRVYNSLVGEGKEKSVIDGGIAEVLAKNDGRIAELYDATAKGDVIGSSKIVSELKEIGFSDEIINRALTKHQNNLMKEIEDDERIEAAAAARYNMDYDEYERIVDEIVSEGYSSNIVKKAVESKKIELETSAYEFKLAGDEEYKASYDLKNAIYNGESSDVKTVHSKLSKDIGKEKADGYVRSYAKEAYKNRKISLNEAERYLLDYKKEESDSNDVFWEVEEMKFGDGYKKYGKLYDAIDNGGNLSATVEYYTSHGVDESTISSYITKEYKPRLLGMNRDTAEFNEMYESVIDAFVATGNTESKARKKVKKWFE